MPILHLPLRPEAFGGRVQIFTTPQARLSRGCKGEGGAGRKVEAGEKK